MANIKLIFFWTFIIVTALAVVWQSYNFRQEVSKKPEENRFTKETLTEDVNQPMQMEILKDGRVLFIEKIGKVKVFDPSNSQVKVIGEIPVNLQYIEPYTTAGGKYDADDGLHGVALDPSFDQNNYIYFYYSPEGGKPKSILARYVWKGDSLRMNSKKVMLEWSTQRNRCCHFGGGMVFDKDDNLMVSIGDNTALGDSPSDAPRKEIYDPQRTAGNTNDLRGSIIRIKPEPDGTYSIPEGNLFSEGTPKTRPEIYIMGVRNPMRLSIDSKTGWLYWGEVGPSTDEFNQARKAGNFGWPYFLANNKKFLDYFPDGSANTYFDSTNIVNNSPFNTGLGNLPVSPVPALVWYSRDKSDDFSIPGTGSLSAMGGPVYRKSDFIEAERSFPTYYNGKWFVTDFVRGWIMVIEMDQKGNFKSMERFLPETTLKGPMDMEFGPEGDLYILEYSRDPYVDNPPDAKLAKIKYSAGNRDPIAQIDADKTAGSVPLQVQLSSGGSIDYDNDSLEYKWKIESKGKKIQTFNQANPVVNFDDPGIYQATLTVSDYKGAQDSTTIEITAGNDPPSIDLNFEGANKSFFFGDKDIEYSVQISDKEDKIIDADRVKVWFDHLPPAYDIDKFLNTLKKRDTVSSAESLIGLQLINQSDCNTCHTLNKSSIGPSYTNIAQRYEKNKNTYERLTEKVISGGSGNWGQAEMPPHTSLTKDEAKSMISYILDTVREETVWLMPLEGNVPSPGNESKDRLIFMASYEDNGFEQIPPIETVKIEVLRNPKIEAAEIDIVDNMTMQFPGYDDPYLLFEEENSHIGVKNIDMTGIKQIEFEFSELPEKNLYDSLEIAVRIDSLEGELVGKTSFDEFDSQRKIVTINSINDMHDIYLLFNNNMNNSIEIRSIKFYQ
ncbi:cytochrome c [Fodinibius roseus]|uniref:Cytochrome c n=1 Tax=Fodinibius roseus TaxID=1194090 RepID=A0A1M5GSX8_9BACT|nr:PQQ-dependent sugar dehydrogenase [Fodinibius roseus]SHG06829.1 cytochrome c [Fodinibius roseus]